MFTNRAKRTERQHFIINLISCFTALKLFQTLVRLPGDASSVEIVCAEQCIAALAEIARVKDEIAINFDQTDTNHVPEQP